MGYFKQLGIKSAVPTQPFPELVDISRRARSLLKDRTEEQINSAAVSINSWIEQFFEIGRDHEIEKMRKERLNEFFIYDGIEDERGEILNGSWVFNDEMEDSLNCPTPVDTSALEALREYADHMWDADLDEESFHKTKDYEIYAVLALLLVEETLQHSKEPYSVESVTAAARSAIAAMEAICYATQKRIEDEIVAEAIQNTKVDVEKVKINIENENKKKRSNHSKIMNDSRNAKRNKAVDLVETEWLKDRNKFLSAPRAGEYFSDWLAERGYNYVDSTVINWIRACAKRNNIKFR
jgi:hypothetical protein